VTYYGWHVCHKVYELLMSILTCHRKFVVHTHVHNWQIKFSIKKFVIEKLLVCYRLKITYNFNFIITVYRFTVRYARGFPQISKVVSNKPVYAVSILLLFLKITTAIVIQYVAVDKTAQPKREKFVQEITWFEKY
jgi:hypothetical protein